MTADDHVKAVYVFADGNPEPDVAHLILRQPWALVRNHTDAAV